MESTSAGTLYGNPHLQRVLKDFKSAAEVGLCGPSRYVSVWGQNDQNSLVHEKQAAESLQEFRKAMLSVTQMKKSSESDKMSSDPYYRSGNENTISGTHHNGPLLIPMDNSHSEKSETKLEGVTIACFIVGGEKRLCLPQILNSVLQDFSLQEINSICDDLHIFCSRCNQQQLELLKVTGVLPPTAPSCGLITKTDAERLCNALLHRSPEKSKEPPTPNSFKVYHKCFGKCKGVLNPELYLEPKSPCVECCDCHGMFSLEKFVVHSHKSLENRTCHWGFDSANWRSYILLVNDQGESDQMQMALNAVKDKFDFVKGYKKRRDLIGRSEDGDVKRTRYENSKDLDPNNPWMAEFVRGMSAFRPWSPSASLATLLKEGKLSTRDGLNNQPPPYLKTGPPVLLNPERVVPFNDKRFDCHFAPNVELAPQFGKDETKDATELGSPVRLDAKHSSNMSSFSSSALSSALSSPSPVKNERIQEHDMSSSDEQSFYSESATTMDEYANYSDNGIPTDRDLDNDRDHLMALCRQALDTEVNAGPKVRGRLMDEVAQTWAKQEDRIRHLLKICSRQFQDLENLKVCKRERLQEMSESRHIMRQEVERLRQELQAKSLEAEAEKQLLFVDIEQLKASKYSEISRVKSKYRSQAESHRCRAEELEYMNSTMAAELSSLRSQLKLRRDSHNNHSGAAPDVKRHKGSSNTPEQNGKSPVNGHISSPDLSPGSSSVKSADKLDT